MERHLERELLLWKQDRNRLPLLLRGARQVGKTYLVESFGKKHFTSFLSINFEAEPQYAKCFEQLDPSIIISQIELLSNHKIIPKETLLFLDEIQECPKAMVALRYFKEKMPELHIIGAGSLLEFALEDHHFSFPTGRVQFIYLNPLSFQEYLLALGQKNLLQYMKEVSFLSMPSQSVHEHLLRLVKDYFFVGGMPAIVKLYHEEKSLAKCQRLQQGLFQTYKSDFGKYASKTQHKYLQRFYEKAPGIIAKHFQYNKIDPEIRSRELKLALEQLCQANLLLQVFATKANGLPLAASINDKKFKLLFLDIGLLQASLQTDSSLLWEDLEQINQGSLAEQFVGQELLAYQDCYQEKKLYFWQREKKTSEAEVDFLTTFHSQIIPIEVKAGSTGRLKSLQQFIEEKKIPFGIRISQHPLSFERKVLSIPFYLIGEMQRLIQEKEAWG